MEVSTYQIWAAGTNGPPQPTGSTRVDIFDKNANGDVVHKWYDGSKWSAWENLGHA